MTTPLSPLRNPLLASFSSMIFVDGWYVFSCAALSKKWKRGRCRDVEISGVETTIHGVVELVKSVVKVISDIWISIKLPPWSWRKDEWKWDQSNAGQFQQVSLRTECCISWPTSIDWGRIQRWAFTSKGEDHVLGNCRVHRNCLDLS